MAARSEISQGGLSEPSSISSTLLGQIRAKRPEAWRRLVDLYGPVVYRWCRQMGVNDADAADLVQEVFVAVAAHLEQFHRDRPEDSFGAWLRTVTQNKVRDHLRRGRHQAAAKGGTDAYRYILELSDSQADALSLASRWARTNSSSSERWRQCEWISLPARGKPFGGSLSTGNRLRRRHKRWGWASMRSTPRNRGCSSDSAKN